MDCMDSILKSVAKLIGSGDDDYFDPDLIIHINTVLSILTQLGVGPSDGFIITGEDETWNDFIGDDKRLSSVISYVSCKTKLIFDPPASSIVLEAMKYTIAELEFRLQTESENNKQ